MVMECLQMVKESKPQSLHRPLVNKRHVIVLLFMCPASLCVIAKITAKITLLFFSIFTKDDGNK